MRANLNEGLMNDDDKPADHIRIKFEISIPFSPTSAPVSVSEGPVSVHVPAAAPSRRRRSPSAPTLNALFKKHDEDFDTEAIISPQAPTAVNEVRQTSAGGGVICVVGEDDFDPDDNFPINLWFKIVPPGTVLTANPAAHGPSVTITGNASEDWEFDVPHAACGATGSPAENLLVIWRQYIAGGAIRKTDWPFLGVCSNMTECERRDEDRPPGHFVRSKGTPKVWLAQVAGFRQHPVDHFNGTWTLIEQRGCGRGEWVAGGSGDQEPKITLIDQPGDPSVHLELKIRSAELIYKCPRSRWNPRGPNAFTSLVCRTLPPDVEVPTAIEIRPAQ
jgi:hypothetical protein